MCYKLKSFAKINLYLHITGKKGRFHLLDTLVVLLGLSDEITIKKSQKNKIILNSKFTENVPEENNIITKILKKLEQDFKIKDKFEIYLKKNIPISAGLGGGSSNGAAVLEFLNKHYNLNLTKEYLKEIAHKIGADIPLFFYCQNAFNKNSTDNSFESNTPKNASTTALVQGIGENITQININDLQNYYILLFNPLFSISTAKVFNHFAMQSVATPSSPKQNIVKQKENTTSPKSIEEIINLGTNKLGTNKFANDLEKNIIELYPKMALYLNTIRQTKCQYSQISGTGATIFALYKTPKELQQATEKMQQLFPHSWLYSQKLQNTTNK